MSTIIFPPGQATVTLGAADDEFTRGVDEKLRVVGEEFFGKVLENEIGFEQLPNFRGFDVSRMLGGDNDSGDPVGASVNVFDGNLGLGIRTQPGVDSILAQFGQFPSQNVGERNRCRHQGRGLLHRIPNMMP